MDWGAFEGRTWGQGGFGLVRENRLNGVEWKENCLWQESVWPSDTFVLVGLYISDKIMGHGETPRATPYQVPRERGWEIAPSISQIKDPPRSQSPSCFVARINGRHYSLLHLAGSQSEEFWVSWTTRKCKTNRLKRDGRIMKNVCVFKLFCKLCRKTINPNEMNQKMHW